MFLNQYSVFGLSYEIILALNAGDQWVMVPDDSLLVQIIQTNTAYILETYSEGIHYIDSNSVYMILPQTEIILRADGYAVLILSPFGGNYITLSRETWEMNLPIILAD